MHWIPLQQAWADYAFLPSEVSRTKPKVFETSATSPNFQVTVGERGAFSLPLIVVRHFATFIASRCSSNKHTLMTKLPSSIPRLGSQVMICTHPRNIFHCSFWLRFTLLRPLHLNLLEPQHDKLVLLKVQTLHHLSQQRKYHNCTSELVNHQVKYKTPSVNPC